MRRAVRAVLAALLLLGCFSAGVPVRRERVLALLIEPVVPVVIDPRALLAVATVERALTFSSGFDEGERLRARFALPSPAPGFAEAFVATLREDPSFARSNFTLGELGASQAALLERGAAPVFHVGVGEWRLYYDLSLRRYRMKLWLHVQVVPAAQAASGSGGMALPERLWSGDCTFQGPETTPLPLEVWLAQEGALLHDMLRQAQQRCGRRVAERLMAFLDRGEEQGAFATGELSPAERH